jgi:hypothetical protein
MRKGMMMKKRRGEGLESCSDNDDEQLAVLFADLH